MIKLYYINLERFEKNMKLLNLNICIKKDNNKEVIELIKEDNYDIITLQEVMRKIENTTFDMYNSSNIIKNNLSYKYSFFGPLWIANYHEKNNVITKNFGGLTEQGNETITNYPIIESRNVFYYKDYSIFIDATNFSKEDHGRAFEEVILDINGKYLQIINVHGIWTKDKLGDERTIKQINSILSNIRNDIPSIVLGDFNLLPHSESIKIISDKMINLISKYNIKTTRPTFDDGRDKGNVVCDYIFVNNKVKVNDFKILDIIVSDHFPLILDFEI